MCALRAAALSRIRLRDPRRDMSWHSGGMHPHRPAAQPRVASFARARGAMFGGISDPIRDLHPTGYWILRWDAYPSSLRSGG